MDMTGVGPLDQCVLFVDGSLGRNCQLVGQGKLPDVGAAGRLVSCLFRLTRSGLDLLVSLLGI